MTQAKSRLRPVSGHGAGSAQRCRANAEDEWQKHVTHEVALAIGQWLEGRGRLNQPIRSLTMSDLEAMASNAISRFVILGSQKLKEKPEASQDLNWLLAC